jgi:hypothetical protein
MPAAVFKVWVSEFFLICCTQNPFAGKYSTPPLVQIYYSTINPLIKQRITIALKHQSYEGGIIINREKPNTDTVPCAHRQLAFGAGNILKSKTGRGVYLHFYIILESLSQQVYHFL